MTKPFKKCKKATVLANLGPFSGQNRTAYKILFLQVFFVLPNYHHAKSKKTKQIKDILIQNIKLVSFMNIINTNYVQFCEYC